VHRRFAVTLRGCAVAGRRRLRAARRRTFEQFGSTRYSHPAREEIERALEAHLPEETGFFVEAGGYDGYTESNTYYLERFRGWSGVLVEPIPRLYRLCVAERPGSRVFNCALVASDFPDDHVHMLDGDNQSVVKGAWEHVHEPGALVTQGDWSARGCRGAAPPHEVSVPARTLTSILDEVGAPVVDLLSLDVEGYEDQVLNGLDLARYAPRLILVEAWDRFGPGREVIEAVIGDRYRQVAQPTPHDFLYARRSEF
jgi:FkbM family methyltransferase